MKKSVIALVSMAALAGCSTTQREEVRNDQRNIQEQQRDVEEAMRTGTRNEVREEQQDVREAKRELNEDQAKLYSGGTAVAPSGATLQVGQRASQNLAILSEQYRAQYPDGSGSYYRTDGVMIYRVRTSDDIITGVSQMAP